MQCHRERKLAKFRKDLCINTLELSSTERNARHIFLAPHDVEVLNIPLCCLQGLIVD